MKSPGPGLRVDGLGKASRLVSETQELGMDERSQGSGHLLVLCSHQPPVTSEGPHIRSVW